MLVTWRAQVRGTPDGCGRPQACA